MKPVDWLARAAAYVLVAPVLAWALWADRGAVWPAGGPRVPVRPYVRRRRGPVLGGGA